MIFFERMNYARQRNKQQSNKIQTSIQPIKTQRTLEEYRRTVISLALTKLKQKKKEQI